MPLNKIPKLREPKGPIVQEIRDKFMEEIYKGNQDNFYEQDINLVRDMEFLLQRCVIMQRKDVDGSVRMLNDVLRWRKQQRVHELSDEYFPQELPLCGAAFTYEPDLFGNKTIYMRACISKNCNELRKSMKEYLAYLMMKVDDPKEGHCFALVLDLTKTSWSNYDLDLLNYLLALLKEYFPVNLDYVLAINFPWILSTTWSVIKHLIPSEKRGAVQFINSDKIFDYIAKENCPDFLGGTCHRPYSRLVEGSPTAIDYLINESDGKIGVKRCKEILNQFRDVLPVSQYEKLAGQVELYKSGQYSAKPKDHFSELDNNNDAHLEDLNRQQATTK